MDSGFFILELDFIHSLLFLDYDMFGSIALDTSGEGLKLGEIDFKELNDFLEHFITVSFLLN